MVKITAQELAFTLGGEIIEHKAKYILVKEIMRDLLMKNTIILENLVYNE